ncbi:MAG: hypothetical protein ACUVYA_12895 [Planctomycetota bacterium]
MDGLRCSAFFAFLAAGLLAGGPADAVEVRGTGAGALLGGDLTDLGNDGVETAYAPPASYGGFDAEFFSSDEPGFEGV